MLTPDPVRAGQERVKILDFGIAKLQRRETPEPGQSGRTATGAVMGTPLYMSPEQFGNADAVEGASDVFALGVILYELLAGRHPYETNSLTILNQPIVPLQQVVASLAPGLSALVMEMLSAASQQRPTMRQVAERLVPFAVIPPTAPKRPSPLRYVLIGCAAAVLALGVIFALVQHRPALTTAQARQLALKAIRAGLQAKAADERLLAVQALGMSRDSTLIELLTPLLADPATVGGAARALGNLGAVAAQPTLLQLLQKAPDDQVRMEAATALAQLAHPTGSTTLHALLRQADGVIQVESALRLLEQNDRTGAALLHRLTSNEASSLPRVLPVLAALARAGDEAARQKLAQLATDSPLSADPLLLYSLARGGDNGATTRLAAVAQKEGPEQVLAARFLAALGQDAGYEVLLQKSSDTRQPDAVREIAIEGLGDRGRFDAAGPLAAVVQGAESPRLRLTAAGAILRLAAGEPSRRAEQSLTWSRAALGSDSAAMRELAVGLLSDVESEATVAPLRQALHDGEREVRRHAAKALGRKHVRAALEALRDALEDADSEVRTAGMRAIGQVVMALRQLGDPNADQLVQQKLQQLARNGEEIDRVVASGILLQTGDASQEETLRLGMRSPSALVRRLSMDMMAQDTQLLHTGLGDRDRLVRLAAARRLVSSDAVAAKRVLRELATSSDEAGLTAYGVLRKLGEQVPEPPQLTEYLRTTSLRERAVVLELLAELPPALGLRLLTVASSDGDALIRQRAATAAYELAVKFDLPEFSQHLLRMRSDANLGVRLTVTELVARLPPRAAAPPAAPASAGLSLTPRGTDSDLEPAPAGESVPTADAPAVTPSAASADTEAEAQKILTEVRAALKSKKYSRAQSLLNRTRKLLRHSSAKTELQSEILFLQGTVYELGGQWRQAMATYTQYEQVPAAQRVAESEQAVTQAVTRLKSRMGKVQIYTLRGGKCQVTEEYYLPAGEHTISLGGGQTRSVAVDVGVPTPVRQCP